jgi:phytoene/squalene synthetase
LIKQEIRALFLANGFKMEQQPDGSTDLNPACYSVAQALAEQFSDIYGQPAGNVEIVAGGGAEARTMALFHDKAASIEFPTYIIRQQSKTTALATSKNPVSGR